VCVSRFAKTADFPFRWNVAHAIFQYSGITISAYYWGKLYITYTHVFTSMYCYWSGLKVHIINRTATAIFLDIRNRRYRVIVAEWW